MTLEDRFESKEKIYSMKIEFPDGIDTKKLLSKLKNNKLNLNELVIKMILNNNKETYTKNKKCKANVLHQSWFF